MQEHLWIDFLIRPLETLGPGHRNLFPLIHGFYRDKCGWISAGENFLNSKYNIFIFLLLIFVEIRYNAIT